jgi:hypothetical protein
MPYHRNPYTKGSLYIEFNVVFPADGQLSAATMQAI